MTLATPALASMLGSVTIRTPVAAIRALDTSLPTLRLAVDEDQAETLGEVGGVERFAQSHLRAELLVASRCAMRDRRDH